MKLALLGCHPFLPMLGFEGEKLQLTKRVFGSSAALLEFRLEKCDRYTPFVGFGLLGWCTVGIR